MLLDLLNHKRVCGPPEGLETLPGVGIVRSLDGERCLEVREPVQVAVEAIRLGLHPDIVANSLGWRDFELFVTEAFESFGYTVTHDLRFKLHGQRKQVDVVAVNNNLVVAVDCKHWSKGGSLVAVVRAQRERSTLLATHLGVKQVLPVVVTLARSEVLNGVPVVAARALRDFILNLEGHLSEFDFAAQA